MITYVYRLYSEDTLLYVGITKNPSVRWASHRAQKSWWLEVKRFEVLEKPTLISAMHEEQEAIKNENPLYNIRNDTNHPDQVVNEVQHPESRRNIPLPKEEISYLQGLPDNETTIKRAYELLRAGWPMQEIAQSVRISPTTAYLRTKFAETVPEATGYPVPELPLSPRQERNANVKTHYVRTPSRALTPDEEAQLAELAVLAKKLRFQHAPTHPYAVAARDLDSLVQSLWDDGITVKQMVLASGIGKTGINARIQRT